jgi:hypothetical protein
MEGLPMEFRKPMETLLFRDATIRYKKIDRKRYWFINERQERPTFQPSSPTYQPSSPTYQPQSPEYDVEMQDLK